MDSYDKDTTAICNTDSILRQQQQQQQQQVDEEYSKPVDFDTFVEDLIAQMNSRFSDVGMSILKRMDDMGTKIDELEQSVTSLIDQAGLDRDAISVLSGQYDNSSSINNNNNSINDNNSTSSFVATISPTKSLSSSNMIIGDRRLPASLLINNDNIADNNLIAPELNAAIEFKRKNSTGSRHSQSFEI